MSTVQITEVNAKSVSYRQLGNGKRRILFFHGFPGSSLQVGAFKPFIDQFDLSAICIDRPGYNQSSLIDGDRFEQTTRMAFSLLQKLGWTSCEVVSVSGGTPFLFSFVQAHPEFVKRVSIVCGLGPINTPPFHGLMSRKAMYALKILPHISGRLIKNILSGTKGNPNQAAATSGEKLLRFLLPASKADLKAFESPSVKGLLGEAIAEAFVQDGRGPQNDAKKFLSNWSVHLGAYEGPVAIWHGEDDQVIPVSVAKMMASLLPPSKLYLIPHEGHYSLPINKIKDVLSS